MALKSFLKQNAAPAATKTVVISNRFVNEKGEPEPFEIRALTEAENAQIRADCTVTSFFKGKQTVKTNTQQYLRRMCAAAVVSPDLKDAELQKSYGVIGAGELLTEMLLPGEFSDLLEQVQTMNGFDMDEELQEVVKNS